MPPPPPPTSVAVPLRRLVGRALREDVGRGDLTTEALIAPARQGRAEVRAGQPLTMAGLDAAREVFRQVDRSLQFTAAARDGEPLQPGALAAVIQGSCASILTGERVALNFLQHLSGIATLAARAMAAVAGTDVKLLDTRKTTPGLRWLEKQAVRAGGMATHRSGLDDGILIKDNHIACCDSAADAVRRARQEAPALLKIEVEIESLDHLEAVVEAGADVILLDNCPPEVVAEAVRRCGQAVLLEASGGITLANLGAYARTGVHRISLGFVTHSASAADLSLELSLLETDSGC